MQLLFSIRRRAAVLCHGLLALQRLSSLRLIRILITVIPIACLNRSIVGCKAAVLCTGFCIRIHRCSLADFCLHGLMNDTYSGGPAGSRRTAARATCTGSPGSTTSRT